MAECVRCTRPMADQAFACSVCGIDRPAESLTQIAEMIQAARDVAQGQTSTGTEGGGGKPGSRIELVFSATARLDAVQNELVGLVRQIAEERGRAVPLVRPQRGPVCAESTCGHPSCDEIRPREPLDAILAAVGWLPGHLEWLRHRQEASEALTTIDACVRVVRGIAGPPRRPKYLGPCGAPAEEDHSVFDGEREWAMFEEGPPCDGDVYGPAGGSKGTCRTCKTEYDQGERRIWLDEQVADKAFRASIIADAYGLNVNTIRSWAFHHPAEYATNGNLIRNERRPKLLPHGKDRQGRPLYLVGDVMRLAREAADRREANRAKREAAEAAESETAA